MMFLRLALLFAIYLSLDFSNPLMPGAISFGDGESVEARQGERLRAADVTQAPLLATTVERVPPAEPQVAVSRRPVPGVSCRWQALLRRSNPWLSGSASLSEDA